MRILSIDGGGIKGFLPALVLAQLEAQAGKPVSAMTDMLARARNWGLAGWARPIIDCMFSATSDVTDHQCRHLLGERYVRLQADFSESVAMDATDARAFAVMRLHAERVAERAEFYTALRLLQEGA